MTYRRSILMILGGLAVLLIAGTTATAGSNLENAAVTEQSMMGSLAATVKKVGAEGRGAWVAYDVAASPEVSSVCCAGGRCELDAATDPSLYIETDGAPAGEATVFLHVLRGEVDDVQAFTADCRVDAAGLPVHQLRGVDAAASVEYLGDWTERTGRADAVMALALHEEEAADRRLDALLDREQPQDLRQAALRWLSIARGEHGFEALVGLLRGEEPEPLRGDAVFSLGLSDVEGAELELLDLLQDDETPAAMRARLTGAYAQQAGGRAVQVLDGLVRDDPSAEVKAAAIFALGRIDAEPARALLTDLAASSSDPEVRRRASGALLGRPVGSNGEVIPMGLEWTEGRAGTHRRDGLPSREDLPAALQEYLERADG